MICTAEPQRHRKTGDTWSAIIADGGQQPCEFLGAYFLHFVVDLTGNGTLRVDIVVFVLAGFLH